MIRSFKCAETEAFFGGKVTRRFRPIQAALERKLTMLDAAKNLNDLLVPPGNRLEALSGDRKGTHSIRVNDKWRICFRWTKEGPDQVEVVDYH